MLCSFSHYMVLLSLISAAPFPWPVTPASPPGFRDTPDPGFLLILYLFVFVGSRSLREHVVIFMDSGLNAHLFSSRRLPNPWGSERQSGGKRTV